MGEEQVFVRKASGLVRSMSPYSALAYNVLAVGILFPWTYLWGSYAFPGADIAVGILLSGAMLIPMWIAFAFLASAMPRSGGDYVFQSRVLGGNIGFVACTGAFLTWVVQWIPMSGWMVNATGLAPMFTIMGYQMNNPDLAAIGLWFNTPEAIIICTVIGTIISALILIRGFGLYVKVQWLLWYAVAAAVALIIISYATGTVSGFTANFNDYINFMDPGTTNYYDTVIQDAQNAGFNTMPPFSAFGTFAIVSIAINSLTWAMLSVEQLGEIKGAGTLKNTTFFIVGAGIIAVMAMALIAGLGNLTAGPEFWYSVAVAEYEGTSAFPVPPYPSMTAPLIFNNPAITFLICFGFVMNGVAVFFNVLISCTRLFLAMGLDRLFPEWTTRVHKRWHTPVNAYIIFVVAAAFWTIAYNYIPAVIDATLSTAAAVTFAFMVTCLAAMLFPYRQRSKPIYEKSAAARWSVGGIPVVAILGGIGFFVNLAVLVVYIFVPALGVASGYSLTAIVVVYIFWIVYYYFVRWYRMNKQGIDVELAFKQIPPE
ncbi:MAG: APC family permease [Promethearchaeota archaeon]